VSAVEEMIRFDGVNIDDPGTLTGGGYFFGLIGCNVAVGGVR
jgi:hypothetical protein